MKVVQPSLNHSFRQKINKRYMMVLGVIVFFLPVFIYSYIHKFSHYGFVYLRYSLLLFALVIFSLCFIAFRNLKCRLLALLTVITFFSWIFSYKFTNNISALVVSVFITHENILLFWLFILSLCSLIYVLFWDDRNKRVLILYITSMILMGSLFICLAPKLSYIYLKRSYQIYSVEKIAKLQQLRGGYYLPMNAEYQYKMSLLKIRKPEIITLGTSRVLGFRQFMFNVPFVNMGRTFGGLKMISTLKDILRIHKPRIIILGLDWWDFIRKSEKKWKNSGFNGTQVIFQQMLSPYEWIFQGKISLKEFFSVIFTGKADGVDNNSYGVPARHHVEGYDKDGSIYYFSKLTALTSDNYQFKHVLHRILHDSPSSGYFKVGSHIPNSKWRELNKIKMLLERHNVKLIIYLAPEPPQIIKAMMKSRHYGYLDELLHSSDKFGSDYYNLFDPRSYGSTACEFIDDLHSGDIVSMRILLAIARDHRNGLYQYINKQKLSDDVNRYAGRADAPLLHDKSSLLETDYLGLGCKKRIDLRHKYSPVS